MAPGEVWLIGVETTRSWDSRYFDPVPLDQVRPVRPVLTLRGRPVSYGDLRRRG
ncbi:MAG: hypothetical protein DMD93_14445 [Candidatus Rokuibacteriota bacterium]|nr:MAG: hypothetical protein DMD93_14445 [Candidatus Rokubacteria bacterium]